VDSQGHACLTQPKPQPNHPEGVDTLSWDELSPVLEGLAFAQRPLQAATRRVTRQYDLGPRGAFILSLISGGKIYPLDLSEMLKAGRSLITAELARLTEAGLVTATPGRHDRRRSELALTKLGQQACQQVRDEMARIVRRNLAGYSEEEFRLFSRMLREVRQLEEDETPVIC
jgi:DNA-binding MarR family transcriptional regulator